MTACGLCRLDARYEEVRGASLAKLESSSSFQLASDGWAEAEEASQDTTRLINIMVNLPSGSTLFQKAGSHYATCAQPLGL